MNIQKLGNVVFDGLKKTANKTKQVISTASAAGKQIQKKAQDNNNIKKLSIEGNKAKKSIKMGELNGRVQVSLNENTNTSLRKLKASMGMPNTKTFVEEGIENGQTAKEAVNGARALMSQTQMQEVPKSAKQSAKVMKENGLFDGMSVDREKALRSKYGDKLKAKKAEEAKLKAEEAKRNFIKKEKTKAEDMLKEEELYSPETIKFKNSLVEDIKNKNVQS